MVSPAEAGLPKSDFSECARCRSGRVAGSAGRAFARRPAAGRASDRPAAADLASDRPAAADLASADQGAADRDSAGFGSWWTPNDPVPKTKTYSPTWFRDGRLRAAMVSISLPRGSQSATKIVESSYKILMCKDNFCMTREITQHCNIVPLGAFFP